LEHPANVRDLLSLLDAPWFDDIDFGHLQQIKTTFIRRDYRHLESDVVLTAPLAGPGRLRKKVLIYILIEHQSEPDRLMPLRLADSQLQIFRYQVRKWSPSHRSPIRARLSPVLPVVFYTGLRRWPQVGTLADLIERGEEFRAVTPIVERPLFVNLPELDAAKLEQDGGFFGWVLRLVQQRKSRVDEFQELLERVVTHLDAMPSPERQRWRELLSYIGAIMYHERSEREQPKLQQVIERSVQDDELRQEVREMGKSMADVLMERGQRKGRSEGRKEGRKEAAVATRQQTLLRQLHRRFGDVPSKLISAVEATTDVDQLDKWLDGLVTASTLGELEIPPTN
jgi:predicted transposase YdaD